MSEKEKLKMVAAGNMAIEKLYESLDEHEMLEEFDLKSLELALKKVELDLKNIRRALKGYRKSAKSTPEVLKG